MKPSHNTILITGGATGIGFALAARFSSDGDTVIICGRRSTALDEAKKRCPSLHTIRCDVGRAGDRLDLYRRVTDEFPEVNVLVNNAGVQNRSASLPEGADWEKSREEIAINLEAPVHLSMLFAPYFRSRESSIINISSGLAFVPLAFMPTYSATKAALHSFTQSLRHQLRGTAVRVIEVAPPAVNTDLGGPGLHTFGVDLDEFADFAFRKLRDGDLEFGYQFSEGARLADLEGRKKIFDALNEPAASRS